MNSEENGTKEELSTATAEISTTQVGLRFGIIVGLVATFYSLTLQILQLQDTQLSWVSALILIGGMVLAMKYYRDQKEGYMSYSQGLGVGTIMATISGFISSALTVAYIQFIDPSIREQLLQKTEEALELQNVTDEQMESMMEFYNFLFSPGPYFLLGVVSSLLIGFILALIISAFMKKDNPEFQ